MVPGKEGTYENETTEKTFSLADVFVCIGNDDDADIQHFDSIGSRG